MAGVLFFGVACDRPQTSYFPISREARWTYAIRSGLLSRVEDVAVTRELSVAGVSGYELGGAMGYSRLAVKDGKVLAENLAGTTYSPPIPILVLQPEDRRLSWSGIITAANRSVEATAVLDQSPSKVALGGRQLRGIAVVLTIDLPTKKLVLKSTFAEGLGLVRQEQHENESQQRYLEYLSGP
ncbi:MAG: hypothetical protein HONBIEJF_01382 [Fimbriimonadaceae bacterium]|nr:hypothetical protein [Fimbriimonadaceae bacterium]